MRKIFDAGDVQANGFQIAEDNEPSDTYTETGASYMGFSASAILASAIADKPKYPISFTGDGSFMMNPQVLIDAVYLGLKGMVVIFDNEEWLQLLVFNMLNMKKNSKLMMVEVIIISNGKFSKRREDFSVVIIPRV